MNFQALPQDVLLHISDHMNAPTLLALSLTSSFWRRFCCVEAWPRRLAGRLSVRTVHVPHPPRRAIAPHPHTDDDDVTPINHNMDPFTCFRILQTLETCPSSRILCLCVHINRTDSLTSLALSYGVSRDDICRTNCLYTEYQLTGRTHVYVPLLTANHIFRATGKPMQMISVVLVRDASLSNKLFPVVACRRGNPDRVYKGLSFVNPRRVVAAAAEAVAAAEARTRATQSASCVTVPSDPAVTTVRASTLSGGTVRERYPRAPV